MKQLEYIPQEEHKWVRTQLRYWRKRYPAAYVTRLLWGYSIKVDIEYYNWCVANGLYKEES